jgi:glutamate racemase
MYMKIGIFDSGLGGLAILKAVRRLLPDYDFVYLGDTLRTPYGNHTPETIYKWTEQGVELLFKNNCNLIIIACNTATVHALRRLQREYLPKHQPQRRILGVVVPTLEAAIGLKSKKLGVLATRATIQSNVYTKELKKSNPSIQIFQQAAPLLASIIEENETALLITAIKNYIAPLKKKKIDTLLLACTHYALIKAKVQALLGKYVQVLSQDDIIPGKLKAYLAHHPEITKRLSKKSTITILVTEKTAVYDTYVRFHFGKSTDISVVNLIA